MNSIEFFAPMLPPKATPQMKIMNTKGRLLVDHPDLRAAREKLVAHLARHTPRKPFEGALSLEVCFSYALEGGHKDREPYTKKPDWDNATKLLQDCLVRLGFMRDDAQIVQSRVVQMYSKVPGIYVKLDRICVEECK